MCGRPTRLCATDNSTSKSDTSIEHSLASGVTTDNFRKFTLLGLQAPIASIMSCESSNQRCSSERT